MKILLAKLLSWMFSGGINAIGDQLNKAYITKLTSKSEREKLQAQVEMEILSMQLAALKVDQKNWITRWIRPAFALPFVIYDFKIIVWDKVLGWGTTEQLPTEFWHLQMVVFTAYFLTRPYERTKGKVI